MFKAHRRLYLSIIIVSPLMNTGDHSATSNNMKLSYTGRWWVGCYIW